MKRHLLLMLVLLVPSLPAQAANKSDYQTGKLIDVRLRNAGSCLAVQVGDLTYLVWHRTRTVWSYQPSDFIVGDPVEVRISGNDLYLQKPKGGELKTRITRQERNSPDGKPITCALPVAVQ